jgi:hypothetical protein
MNSKYGKIKDDRAFRDELINVLVISILTDGDFDEYLQLQIYYDRTDYEKANDIHYRAIKDCMSEKSLKWLKQIVKDGRERGFRSLEELKLWLVDKYGFSHCDCTAITIDPDYFCYNWNF